MAPLELPGSFCCQGLDMKLYKNKDQYVLSNSLIEIVSFQIYFYTVPTQIQKQNSMTFHDGFGQLISMTFP